MFTKEQINEILAVCEKATEGPWQIVEQGKWGRFILDRNSNYALEMDYPENDNFVVVARTVLPQLAQRVLELEGEVDPYWMNKAQELDTENANLRAVAEAAKRLYEICFDMPIDFPSAGPFVWGMGDLKEALTAAGYGGGE